MLSAEIIAIGSELLTPEKTDTNGLWLTEKLNEFGIEVMLKTIVGDDEPRLLEVIKDALKRSDVVITTGGLGPTEDDITRQVSAKALGRELIYNEGLEAELRRRFQMMGREMPEINKRQAWVIEGAEVIANPNGSAPGIYFGSNECILVNLPGPPREMKPMFEQAVLPRLSERAGEIIVKRRILRVSGMGESAVDAVASPIYKTYENVRTAILFNKTEVEIHLYARYATEADADAVLAELSERLSSALGVAVFTTTGETMEEVVGRMLRERGETLSLAESCTGGLVSRRITEVPGSSEYFSEGAVTYSNEAKVRTLDVPEETLAAYGAVSAETAEAMAKGIRARAGTDHAVSITGIAGPGGGTEEKPVGTVFIGYAGPHGVRSIRLVLPGDRYLIRWRTSQAALDHLRRQMLKQASRDKL
ncbi:MAG TPA: competence/damage-inducible protein A [Pyrinomonadaceae bacterium]|nr:competence/damage-inducible protein A [Pyrinomonadaceae bacterium]HMP65147.1 competence/damage-inducible protein A [Pyrinomonadaceae bacterium]